MHREHREHREKEDNNESFLCERSALCSLWFIMFFTQYLLLHRNRSTAQRTGAHCFDNRFGVIGIAYFTATAIR